MCITRRRREMSAVAAAAASRDFGITIACSCIGVEQLVSAIALQVGDGPLLEHKECYLPGNVQAYLVSELYRIRCW